MPFAPCRSSRTGRAVHGLPAADRGQPGSRPVAGGPARVVPVGEIPERPSLGRGPDGLAIDSERRAALLSALDRLGADQRAVIRLRILEGRTASEVGFLTNRSSAAVRQLQVRAVAALRAALNDQLGEMTADFGRD